MRLKKFVMMALMSLLSLSAYADVTVTGIVVEAGTNDPIIGASVVEKGRTSNGVATDVDGAFTLTLPSYDSRIVVTYVGMKAKEVKASSKPLTIVLDSDSQTLDEVVVTGMSKVDKRIFTGATTQISADKAKLDGVSDVSRSLEGRSAGVSVQNVSGTFGTAPKIRVRGATSIYGASKPLWVVDGVVMEDAVEVSADDLSSGDAVTLISSAIAGLNSDDIESFQILKDGSATSIYGARAMAGVIVVTTKKGKAGHTRVSYTGELTTRLKPHYSEFNISNSQEQMGIYREMEQKGWLEFANLAKASTSGVYGKMYQLIASYANGKFGIENTQAARNAYLREAEFRNTDWFDLLFSNAVLQNHSFSIAGGTDKGNFYTSLSVMNDPGWTLSSNVRRYTFNANASYQISPTLKFSVLTSDSYRQQKAPGTLSSSTDAVSGTVNRDFDINPYSYAINASRALDPTEYYTRNYTSFNIFNELDNNYIDINVTDLKFQAELNWKPIKGLDINALGAYRYQSSVQQHYVKDNSNQANAYRAGIDPEDATIRDSNSFLYTDPDDPNALPVSVMPQGGIYYNDTYTVSQYDFRGTATYNKTWNNTHIFNVMGGLEVSSTDRKSIGWEGWGFVYDNGGVPSLDYKLFKQQIEEGHTYYAISPSYRRSFAAFANATYSYKARYVLNGTIRYEGTNKLGMSRNSRWLPTWNVSGAWNAHEEGFFREKVDPKVLSHATARVSYSLTADSGPSSISNATPIYTSGTAWRPSASDQELMLELSTLGNSELTYEKKHEFNFGVDLGFLNNRINASADIYFRNNFDLIGLTYTPGVGGESMKYANVASMKSHGAEVTISTSNLSPELKDWKWSTDLTFSKTKSEITDLQSRSSNIYLVNGAGYALQGYPVRSLFSYQFAGLNEQGIPQVINENGEVVTSDVNFQSFDATHLVYEGPTDPTITGGFGNTVSWKNFRLNVFLTYSFGNKIRLDPVFKYSYDDMQALPREFKNRWVTPGDEMYTTIPAIATYRQYVADSQLSRAYNAYNYSTERIADGGFVRLKEISLTYDLPESFLKKIRFSSASVKVQATNLCLLYADKKLNGQDPEFFNTGGVATPNPKQFTFTLRFSL